MYGGNVMWVIYCMGLVDNLQEQMGQNMPSLSFIWVWIGIQSYVSTVRKDQQHSKYIVVISESNQ